jgi:hypothetical protein
MNWIQEYFKISKVLTFASLMSNLAQFFQFLYIAGVKVGIWHLGRVEKY